MISLAVRELLPLLEMIPGEDARIRRKTMVQTTLKIDGMMCGMCESHINDAIRKEFPVKKVTASHSKGICVIISDAPLDEAKLRKTIDDTGYTLLEVQSEPYEKKGGLFGLFHHQRSFAPAASHGFFAAPKI